jgi:hypothetical protein
VLEDVLEELVEVAVLVEEFKEGAGEGVIGVRADSCLLRDFW